MSQQNPHTPPAETPQPADPHGQQAAANYARQQLAEVYGEEEQARPASPSTDAPEAYARTFNEDGQPATPGSYDWQTYHSAWQNYYQEYYQRYYLGQLQQLPKQTEASQLSADSPKLSAAPPPLEKEVPASRLATANALQKKIRSQVAARAQKAQASPHFKPIVSALVVGFAFLFLQFNRTIIAQVKYYISPGTLVSEGSSIIIDPTTIANVGQESRIIIPKINVDVPVVYNEPSYDETKIQKALQRGVVHYGNSALPGTVGNNVIVGHSSNDLFDSGDYKFAFVLIDRLNNGDVFMLNYKGKRYVYKVYNKKVISPSDFSLINITPDKPVVTLITCTPPGTALKRLVVQAEQISPQPNTDQVAQKPSSSQPEALPSSIPGNSPTLFEKIKGIFN